MRAALSLSVLATLLLLSPLALPCGAGFGEALEIEPSQQIVLAERNGEETYVFNPYFCGEATEFGLILPVPAALSRNPELAQAALFTQLDELTKPIEIEKFYCPDYDKDSAAGGALENGDRLPPHESGVDVVDTGQVGIFDWALLQATSTDAFTTWLDTNGFPYQASATEHFDYYVAKAWHFVAFRVTAGAEAPPAGMKLCGNLGPLSLTFPASEMVIPARITATDGAAHQQYVWQVFTLADRQMQSGGNGTTDRLLYSGRLTEQTLQTFPALQGVAVAGERLTKLNISFYSDEIADDITLGPNPVEKDYREIKTKMVEDCGCSLSRTLGSGPARALSAGIVLAALLAWCVRRRRRRG